MRNVRDGAWSAARHLRLPPGGPQNGDGGLAGCIHGLGLLAITAMVLIGGAFYPSRMAGASHGALGTIENVHDVFAVIVGVYRGGHLVVTLLHSALRQRCGNA